MVRKHFAGDTRAAKARWAAIGFWNSERVFEGTPIPVRTRYPGTVQEFRARYYQCDLFNGAHRDVEFYPRED